MSELQKVIDSLVKSHEFNSQWKPVRFTVSLDYINNRRTEYVSKKLSISKQELISRLYLAALEDLEVKLGLVYEDLTPTGKLERDYTGDYVDILSSNKPINDYFTEE